MQIAVIIFLNLVVHKTIRQFVKQILLYFLSNRPPGRFGGVADTDCERLTEYGIETVPVSARW